MPNNYTKTLEHTGNHPVVQSYKPDGTPVYQRTPDGKVFARPRWRERLVDNSKKYTTNGAEQ
jgi:hypothetical protein